MDRDGFRAFLQARRLSDMQIEPALDLAEEFERFVAARDGIAPAEVAWEFSEQLIRQERNTEEAYITLVRYSYFIKNSPLYVAILELLDGAEAQANFYGQVAEIFGDEIRDEVFAGIGIAPMGLPTSAKPAAMHPVIQRLEAKVGTEACKALLGESLRDLPDEYFQQEWQRFQGAGGDVDEYLRLKKQAFVEQLETCQREGRLFFAQEVTDEVIAYVKNDPEIGGGRREGNLIYETKIPFMTPQYLAETDPVLRRYYYCHCPWSREAIKRGDVQLTPVFCNCSAGFHKKPWEVALGQPVKAEVLESVLKGDERCRFVIELPVEQKKKV